MVVLQLAEAQGFDLIKGFVSREGGRREEVKKEEVAKQMAQRKKDE